MILFRPVEAGGEFLWVCNCGAEEAVGTGGRAAALGVVAINQAVCEKTEEGIVNVWYFFIVSKDSNQIITCF